MAVLAAVRWLTISTCGIFFADAIQYTVVETKLGEVRGAVRSYGELTVKEFLGIRYAQPPVGEMRFAKPTPVRPWSPATYDALALGDWCPQPMSPHLHQQVKGLMSEDCLFLNVYAPYEGPEIRQTPRAVMVFVHGGGFKIGSSSQFIGSGLASVGDVVVVTINYRLDVFGFLSSGNQDSPGNYGLWDQREAFKWVRDNIGPFGGDPLRITVFGQSAGAASMNYHAISPANDRTLFQRLIVESGSFHSPWAFQYSPLAAAVAISDKLNCPNNQTAMMVACLRSKSVDDLLANSGGLAWVPAVDGDFVLDTPDVMTQKVLNGSKEPYIINFANYDYLVGFNSQEALMFVDKSWTTESINAVSKNLTGKDISDGLTDAVYNYAINLIGEFYFVDSPSVELFSNYTKLIYKSIYIKQNSSAPPDARDMLRIFVQIAGDFELVAPTVHTLNLHAFLNGGGKRYQYMYDVMRSFEEPRNIFWEGPDWLRTGADHADELSSVLAYPWLQGFLPNDTFVHKFNYTAEERELSKAVIQYWTNYAKSGDPNVGRPLWKPWVAWPSFDYSNKTFLHIRVNESVVYHDVKAQEDFFWNSVVIPNRNRFGNPAGAIEQRFKAPSNR